MLAALLPLLSGALLPIHAVAFDHSPPVDTCRYFGEDFEQSKRVCMNTPDGPRVVVCAMELNNPNWKALQPDGGCDPVREAKPRSGGRALDYAREYILEYGSDKP